MTYDLRFVDYFAAISLGILSLMLGLRMLVVPGSLKERSFIYRYMEQRLRYLIRTNARHGQLSHRQIRLYGFLMVSLGLLSFAIVLV